MPMLLPPPVAGGLPQMKNTAGQVWRACLREGFLFAEIPGSKSGAGSEIAEGEGARLCAPYSGLRIMGCRGGS